MAKYPASVSVLVHAPLVFANVKTPAACSSTGYNLALLSEPDQPACCSFLVVEVHWLALRTHYKNSHFLKKQNIRLKTTIFPHQWKSRTIACACLLAQKNILKIQIDIEEVAAVSAHCWAESSRGGTLHTMESVEVHQAEKEAGSSFVSLIHLT